MTNSEQETFIKEKMASYASNIADFKIGDKLKNALNGKDNRSYIITDMTINTIEVLIPADPTKKDIDGKLTGVKSKQWFLMGDFNKKFKK